MHSAVKVFFYIFFQGLGDGEQTFVVEVFSGCVRYNRVLKTVTDGFYNRDGSGCLRSEENLYKG